MRGHDDGATLRGRDDGAHRAQQAAVEALLRQHSAEGYAAGWDSREDRVEFRWQGLQIRFVLPRPNRDDHQLTPGGLGRTDRQITQAMQQADRQRWRALFLVVRAKLESVEAGIAVFQQEFFGFVVNPLTNQTIYEMAVPRLAAGVWNVDRLLPASEGPEP